MIVPTLYLLNFYTPSGTYLPRVKIIIIIIIITPFIFQQDGAPAHMARVMALRELSLIH